MPRGLESRHLSFEINRRVCLTVITAEKFQIREVTAALTHPVRPADYLIPRRSCPSPANTTLEHK